MICFRRLMTLRGRGIPLVFLVLMMIRCRALYNQVTFPLQLLASRLASNFF